MIVRTSFLFASLAWLLGCPSPKTNAPAPSTDTKPLAKQMEEKAKPPKGAPDFKAAFKHEIALAPDGKTLTVNLDIQEGYHAYTEGETIGLPLLVKLDETSELVLDGKVRYPKGKEKQLPIGKSVVVEGKAKIEAPLKAMSKTGKTAKGLFRYQICRDDACDRPRTQKFALPAS